MADISKIKIKGVEYSIKDIVARAGGSGGTGTGADGFSPLIDVVQSGNGDVILTITDKEGTETVTIPAGANGDNGQDGGYYTPSVNDGWLAWSASKGGMPAVMSANIRGPQGEQGEQGPKGDTGTGFTISKTYSSVSAMNAGYATDGVPLYGFVLIDTGNVNDEDNAKLYVKGDSSYEYLTDLSGSQGIKGETGEKGDKGDAGSNGVSATHSWSGTTLTITSASGTSSANLKGDKGDTGEQGLPGETGVKGDDGYTPVKGTDYWTEADKTEIKNYVASDVINTLTLGINPADGLLYIYKDGRAIGSGIEISGGASIGYVDVATNTIIINTSLGEGTYVVQYETEEGDPIYIGELEIDNSVRYTVTNNLTNCSTNNSVAQVIGGESYTALITPDTGYIVDNITVIMGENDITSTAVEGNTISIASVDGDIEITATAIEQVESNNPTITNNLTNCSNSNNATEIVSGNSYSATISTTAAYALSTLKVVMGSTDISSSAITKTTTGATISIPSVTENVTITATAVENLIAKSVDTDGTIYNGVGYQSGKSQSSSTGNIDTQAGYNVTGFMPVVANQTIRIKNIDNTTSHSRNNIVFYSYADGVYTRVTASTMTAMFGDKATDEGNGVYSRKLVAQISTDIANNISKIQYMRFSSPKIDSTSVIVVDKTII